MITEAALASFVATLFSMLNPIGAVGIFAGMTEGRSRGEVIGIAWTCASAVAIVLLIVTWSGSLIMNFFGISVDALRAAGGVIILLIGLKMLGNKSDHKHSESEIDDAKSRGSIAVVPLAIPIVAGPGAIAAVLVAVHQHKEILGKVEISIAVACLAAVCGALFSAAQPITNKLGKSGMGVVTRIMGMILAAIAMGMLTEGLKALLPGLAG
jgi:multiple antibiotic resistance protein